MKQRPTSLDHFTRAGVFSLLAGLLLTACASDPATTSAPREPAPVAQAEAAPPPFTLDDRLGLSLPVDPQARWADARMPKGAFSFDYTGDISGAVRMFAARYGLNVIVSPDVNQGGPANVAVSFADLPFDKAMEALLTTYGYHWEYEEGLWRVYQFETRIFAMDYLRLTRQGTGSAQANLASSSGGSSSSGSDGVTIGHTDSIDFWKELRDQLRSMLSDRGQLIINQTAGIIQITDRHQNMAQIARFIETLTGSAHRQVEIEAKIFEVTLNDHSALGIDWTRVTLDAGLGVFNSAATYSPTAPPMFGDARNPSMGMTYNRGDFTAVLSALKEQGELNIVSQPKITVLNNQPALIKVGTDQPYFTRQSNTASGGAATEITYTTNYVTIGVVLSVTPQISDDGQVILNVTPIVSRLLGMETINNPVTLEQAASAPIIDVKQSSTLVRIRNDQMAVIAGLITEETSTSERKVPLLGDIPGLGALFRGNYETKSKSELVIFLTPRIVKE